MTTNPVEADWVFKIATELGENHNRNNDKEAFYSVFGIDSEYEQNQDGTHFSVYKKGINIWLRLHRCNYENPRNHIVQKIREPPLLFVASSSKLEKIFKCQDLEELKQKEKKAFKKAEKRKSNASSHSHDVVLYEDEPDSKGKKSTFDKTETLPETTEEDFSWKFDFKKFIKRCEIEIEPIERYAQGEKDKVGFAILFNNISSESEKYDRGEAQHDLNQLRDFLLSVGYEIMDPPNKDGKDLSINEFLTYIANFQDYLNKDRYAACFVAIISEGNESTLKFRNDRTMNIYGTFLELFNSKNRRFVKMKFKPKIIILQTCSPKRKQECEAKADQSSKSSREQYVPIWNDIILFQSLNLNYGKKNSFSIPPTRKPMLAALTEQLMIGGDSTELVQTLRNLDWVRNEGQLNIIELINFKPYYFPKIDPSIGNESNQIKKIQKEVNEDEIKGNALLINVIEFKDKKQEKRTGALKDESLVKTLQNCGFNVEYRVNDKDKNSLNKKGIMTLVKNFLSECQSTQYNAYFIGLMSHGDENIIYAYDGEEINFYEEIIQKFNVRNSSLKEKPKIFAIQACQGDEYGGTKSDGHSKPSKWACWENTVVFSSTMLGCKSYRNSEFGTHFIQSLCHQINLYKDYELIEIFRNVAKLMDDINKKNAYDTPKQQTSPITMIHFKEFYLSSD